MWESRICRIRDENTAKHCDESESYETSVDYVKIKDVPTYTFTTTSKSKAVIGMSKSPSQNTRLENIIRSMPAKTAPNLNNDQKWLQIETKKFKFSDRQISRKTSNLTCISR